MNAKNRSVGRLEIIFSSALALFATSCATHVHQRTVYVPPRVVETAAPAPQLPAPVVVATPVVAVQSESDFYEPLDPYGRWVVIAGYGRSWVPARVGAEWRPYSDGHWQHTDAGWYWVSEEPWGWATYHYGRWDWNVQFGWFWVPQTQWAPAWVAWREGNGYVGWAPLRPSVAIGLRITPVHYEPAFASRAYVFVEHRHMMERVRPKTVVVNNTTIINQTVNITKINVVNHTVINEGPRPDAIERESGRKLPTVAARDFRHREESVVAARIRNLAQNAEHKIETPIGRNVETRPTPTPSPRKEKPIERSANATQPSAPARQPVTVSPQLPTRQMGNEVVRQDDRKFDTTANVREAGRSAEKQSQIKPPTARPTANRPTVRNVEKPAEVITESSKSPALPAPARSNAPRKLEQVDTPARLIQAANSPVKSEVKRQTDEPAKREANLQLSRGHKPAAPSSTNSVQTAQMSPRKDSRPTARAEARSDERGKGGIDKERD